MTQIVETFRMGQRANLIVIENGNAEIYYTHHRANTLDQDLFWGPRYALGFIRAQRRMDTGELLDDVWAEGGAVMDLDRRSLLWFGGEDISCDVPLRRVHQKLMRVLWNDWDVQWMHGGVADIARSLGRPMESVLSTRRYDPIDLARLAPRPDCKAVSVVILVHHRQLYLFKFLLRVDMLIAGSDSKLADRLIELKSSNLNWDGQFESSTWFSGLTVDVDRKTVSGWTSGDFPAAAERLAAAWPGWTTRWDDDRFESQIEASNGRLRPLPRTDDAIVAELRQILLQPDGDDNRAHGFISATKAIASAPGIDKIEIINPLALFDAPLSLSLVTRTRLFDAATSAAH